MARRIWLPVVLGVVAAGVAGCPPPPRIALETIIAKADANSAQVTTLSGQVGVSVLPPGQKVFALTLDGLAAFGKPNLLRLQLSKFGQAQVDLGLNEKEYWFWSREALVGETPNTVYRGSVEKMDDPRRGGLPLPPEAVADALGANALIPAAGGLYPLREQQDDFYAIDYVRLAAGRLRLVKKTYLDPYTGRMTRTEYFQSDGRRFLIIAYNSTRTEGGVRLMSEVTLEVRDWKTDPKTGEKTEERTLMRFDLRNLRLNPTLNPEVFERPEFPGATAVDP